MSLDLGPYADDEEGMLQQVLEKVQRMSDQIDRQDQYIKLQRILIHNNARLILALIGQIDLLDPSGRSKKKNAKMRARFQKLIDDYLTEEGGE